MKISHILVFSLLVLSACAVGVSAQEQPTDPICMYYFTGIGCPHCANVDPVLFGPVLEEYPDLIIIEYEIYQHQENVPVFRSFVAQFGISPGVPNLLMGLNGSVSGDTPILNTLPGVLANRENITAQYGDVFFGLDQCPIGQLTGSPQVWRDERILIKNGTGTGDDAFLQELLLAEDLNAVLKGKPYEEINASTVVLSGTEVEFEHAIRTGDWILQWNGEPLKAQLEPTPETPLPGYLAVAGLAAAVLVFSRVKRR
jgi:hypothetical protein